MGYYNQLLAFLAQSKTDNLKTNHYEKKYLETKVKVSFGQGNSARIPWVSFLLPPNSTSNGIYPVYLLYKEYNILILSYGVSETTESKIKWGISDGITISEYFKNNFGHKPERYGTSYVCRVYRLKEPLNENEIDDDLAAIIQKYKYLANAAAAASSAEISKFDPELFYSSLLASNLKFEKTFSTRLIASLCTKPFLILTGLTGSGKTKLAQSFAYWLSGTVDQYEIVPVGADWTNREPLLGYPDGLDQKKYIHPDSKVLELIMRAEESDLPHFIILDEMNLSHVERYFADFLSIMESGETAKLYSGANRIDGFGRDVPQQISWPKNLYIIGTVNIDESTYMFSPKVLDRANVIEFRVTELEMEEFLQSVPTIDLEKLKHKGASMGLDFVALSEKQGDLSLSSADQEMILKFFTALKRLGAEFGYRSASEISTLLNNLNKIDGSMSIEERLDIAIMQKMLPKLHGSRTKLLPVLEMLGKLCLKESTLWEDYLARWKAYLKNVDKLDFKSESNIIYKLSFEKVIRMYSNALDNGFASYAEA